MKMPRDRRMTPSRHARIVRPLVLRLSTPTLACLCAQVNFRRGLRNVAFARGEWDLVDPPPPEECGQLLESHEEVAAELLEAGNHGACNALPPCDRSCSKRATTVRGTVV